MRLATTPSRKAQANQTAEFETIDLPTHLRHCASNAKITPILGVMASNSQLDEAIMAVLADRGGHWTKVAWVVHGTFQLGRLLARLGCRCLR